MTEKSYKVLITNVYSWLNKGDATIVLAMIENLNKYFTIGELGISTVDVWDFGKYGAQYDYHESLQNYVLKWKNKFVLLTRFIYFLSLFFLWWYIYKYTKVNLWRILFSSAVFEKLMSYGKYDVVIACWGGYTWTKSHSWIINKILFCFDFFIWYFHNKKIFLYSQSFGPLYVPLHGYILKFFISKSIILECREKVSFRLADKYWITNKILTWDIAFCLSSWKEKYTWVIPQWKNIWITTRFWFSDKEKQDNYEKQIAYFIEKTLHDNPDINFIFIPQVIYEKGNDNDLSCFLRIKNKIEKKRDRVVVINNDLNPYVLKDLISKCDYFVWTRMHSNILALSSHIKTIAISYEHKTDGIMEDLGLENYCVNINTVTGTDLSALFEKLVIDKSYLEILKKNMIDYKLKADRAWLIIANLLD